MLQEGSNEGWWFLAFDYRNFRVCNCLSNQLSHDSAIPPTRRPPKAAGKSDFFPLKKGSIIATEPSEVENEIYCLLDPCNPDDPEYISYNDSGEAFTLYRDKWVQCRVDVSIKFYNLDETQLQGFRKEKWNQCKDLVVEEIAKALKEKDLKKVLERRDYFFNELADKSKEFSAVAIDCIRYYKSAFKWLDSLFPDNRLVK